MSISPTIRHAAGSLLVVGLAGPELSALERAWLKTIRPGGIILFKRNIADAAQTRALLDDATTLCRPNPMRCVDVEGGAVNRFRDALAPIPSAQAASKSPKNARQHGDLIARAVKAFGFNTTLAPVLDLALPESAELMGTRAAGATAAEVIAYARPFFEALKAQGVAGCAKHFPGLGGGTADTHLVTPAIARTFSQLWREDLLPYRELHRLMPLVMINHAAYPATPGKQTPASISPFWITAVLRKRIGYRGLIFSDDFEMGGILKFMPIEEAAIAAIRAGIDSIEICHSPQLILRAYESLLGEAERSASFRKLLLARAGEVARKRSRLFSGKPPRPLTTTQLTALRNRILRFNDAIAAPETNAKRTATLVEVA